MFSKPGPHDRSSSAGLLLLIHTMRSFGSICVVVWTLVVSVCAKSIAGDRVLVVLEDTTEKDLYSQFWSDLECKQSMNTTT